MKIIDAHYAIHGLTLLKRVVFKISFERARL